MKRLWTGGKRRVVLAAVGERIGGSRAAAGGVIEARDHFQHRAFDHRAHRELDRLERALADRGVEEVRAQEVEHAGRDLAADDLLLVGDHVDDLRGVGVDQPKVEADIHHIDVAAGSALDAVGGGAAAVGAGAFRADVEVQFGDAADEVVVGAGDRTRDDLAVVAVGRVRSSPISLLLAYFSSISATEVSKRSTSWTPAFDSALIAIRAAPWVILRPELSASLLPV